MAEHNFKSDTFEMDIKDCRIKTPAELSVRHSDISVGKGVTGKSALPYETAQCSTRTEFPVLASPRPFSCFYAALHRHTSICTSALRMATRFPLHARCFPHARISAARSLFPACPRPLAFPLRARCSPHARSLSSTPMPDRISAARSLFPARPLAFPHARSLSHPLAFPLCDRCFPRAHSLFPAHPRPLAFARSLFPAQTLTVHARSLFPARPSPLARSLPCTSSSASRFLLHLALPPPPRASSSASRFPSTSHSPLPRRRSRARHRTR
ncbi:hypothetical protein B0H13DRAFT_2431691 [Mycena leptocephala]|nr:hypothetical protein B0H13DRAFT_2431691 [Mycena leptocephala]